MNPLPDPWHIVAPVALGALAIRLLLPRDGRRLWWGGALCGLAALLLLVLQFRPVFEDWAFDGLFFIFAGGAIGSGVMMITSRNPVYSALWFALVTLNTCGLFLLNSAPFLAAATIIVYAGAIVVTFIFVIMLAQQGGTTQYDGRAYQPTVAVVGAALLLGSVLYTLDYWSNHIYVERPPFLAIPETVADNPLSQPVDGDLGTLKGVGRSLFGDYLYQVELAGTILLITTIGAIAVSPRRSQGHF